MKNDAGAFVEWFEKEREIVIDRVFKALEERSYEELGCGLVMELHQQALAAAAEQIAQARAAQMGYRAVAPFSGYEEYRYSRLHDEFSDERESLAPKKRRGPGRKRKDAQQADEMPQLFPTSESEKPPTQAEE